MNVYDTISHSIISNFFTGVSGYTSALNFTKGNLAATAYRTKTSDSWNFKYYRYDVRGRVIKLWNIISGFDTLVTEYQYNSQDQEINYTHKGPDDFKRFRNIYDYSGRLYQVDHFYEPGEEDNQEYYTNLLEYNYNENSQTDELKMNAEFINTYSYNNRNWITSMEGEKDIFYYSNNYFKNGNVKSQVFSGGYNDNFTGTSDLTFTYKYDRSNRLTETKSPDKIYELYNTYDKDGNILTLQRNGSTGNSIDDFNYSYYSGTNKLSKVTGSVNLYAYDANGNMIRDDLNKNFDIIYDHRNLIVELKQLVIDIHGSRTDSTIYETHYYYDESGNRIRKKIFKDKNDSLLSDIIYSRDVSGKEMTIYENGNIKQWNIWGIDNAGLITGEGDKRYYLKDHLGSVRAVIDDGGSLISAQDYDAWGYLLQNRNYNSEESIYKFTSKERDEENKYDYSYARNYNSRIGIFNSTEPIPNSSFGWGSYIYCADNPLRIIDPSGEDWFQIYGDNGKSSWKFFKDEEWKNIWTGKYDEKGNKIFENVQGNKELLFFQGSELQWLQENGNRMIWKAVSGILDELGNTQSKMQKEKDEGPIPEGNYTVSPEETYSIYKDLDNLELWQIPVWFKDYKSWGFYKTPISPIGGTETYGRSGFYIHGGFLPGSKGCIDLTMGNSDFHEKFMEHNKTLILNVQYP